MAMIDIEDSAYLSTERLISTSDRKRFPVSIRSQHWQLRALTALATDNVLCFPGGTRENQIHTLNLDTDERFAIGSLQFAPRSLAAGRGWICCGGEYGQFSAIKVYEVAGTQNASATAGPHMGSKPKCAKFASERVNCVTQWFPPAKDQYNPYMLSRHPTAYRVPVAVLANNDKTVKLVDLESFNDTEFPEPLDSIEYPDYVNRAVLSPDGKFLAAVLDDPYLYVHKRIMRNGKLQWELCLKHMLKSQDPNECTDQRGSFAVTFSPSGVYLAVGTQHGVVSVFDVDLLDEEDMDPVVATFNSSRPGVSSGAIRDMAFTPGTQGLLAWTEDRGRIGVADIKSQFTRFQIIDLKNSKTFEEVPIDDHSHIGLGIMSDSQYNAIVSRAFRRKEPSKKIRRHSHSSSSGSVVSLETIVHDMGRDMTTPLVDIADALEADLEESAQLHDSEYILQIHMILPNATGAPLEDPSRRSFIATYIRNLANRRRSSATSRQGHENTSGMAWNSTGETLFVGSEDGIYEMHVNPMLHFMAPDDHFLR